MLQRAIERLFGTKIHPHERRVVALLTLDLFILLSVYYILKIVREPLILLEGGVVSRNGARGAQAFVLMALVPAYSALANRMQPRRLVTAVFGVFLLSMLVFPVLTFAHVPIGFPFFVWLGIFSITVVAQFWSLANDLFTEEAGKRLFPVIAAGSTIGAVGGAQFVAITSRWLQPPHLILVAAFLLAICIWLTGAARREAESQWSGGAKAESPSEPPMDPRGGFRLLIGDGYLLLIASSILVLNLINTTGDQVLALLVQEHAATLGERAARSAYLMTFYGNFQTWISALTAVLQVFAVSRILRVASLRGALLVLPLLALTGYGLLAAVPALIIIRALKIVENSTEYSLQNTLQQVLFLPTSRDAKYKGKAATDTFFVRFGDLGSWAAVSLALRAGWGATALSLFNVGVAALWVLFAVLLGRRYRGLTHDTDAPASTPVARAASRR